jgi:hypothetical protein
MKLDDFIMDIGKVFDDMDSCLASALQAVSGVVETNSEMGNISNECIDKETGETVSLGDLFDLF